MTSRQRPGRQDHVEQWPESYPGPGGDAGVTRDWPAQAREPEDRPGGYGLATSAWDDPAAATGQVPDAGQYPHPDEPGDVGPGPDAAEWPAAAGPPQAGWYRQSGDDRGAWTQPHPEAWQAPGSAEVTNPNWYLDADPGYGPGPRRPVIRRRRRLLAVAVVTVVVAAAAAVLLTRAGTPAGRPAAGTIPASSAARPSASQAAPRPAAPPLTVTAARHVLAGWLTANNEANMLRSSNILARIEGGTSFQMDAGGYRWKQAEGSAPSQPITLANPSFSIPAGSGSRYPQWFAVTGQWTRMDGSRAGLDAAVLVFTRASATAPWLEVLEPDLLPGSSRIHVARTAAGQAEQVAAADAAGLSVAPADIQQLTARYLDGGRGLAGFSMPGNLQDLRDEQYWKAGNLPPGAAVTVTHAVSGNPVYALRTTDGGAVLLYDLTATMTFSAPPGDSLKIKVPGYLSPDRPVTSATLGYVDQFATYDPPRGSTAGPVVIASAGGIASRG